MPIVEVWMGPVGLARCEWSSLEMLGGRGGAVSEDEPFWSRRISRGCRRGPRNQKQAQGNLGRRRSPADLRR